MKIPKPLRKPLWFTFGTLYVAGLSYWLTHLFFRKAGEFGDEPSLLEVWLGPTHLLAAFLFIFFSGIIWSQHASLAMQLKRSRKSGWIFYFFLSLLAISGIMIVYGGDSVMRFAGKYHPWIGASLLPLFTFHGWWNKFKKRPINPRAF